MLTTAELKFAAWLRKEGLTFSEITYLRWSYFSFDNDKITLDRNIWFIHWKKKINLKKDKEIWHLMQTWIGKKKYFSHYHVFYKSFPVRCTKYDNPRRYGSLFTPEEMQQMVSEYRGDTGVAELLGYKLMRI